ncbi:MULTISPECIES: transaldolase [unclassified Mesorhizobium]|uniref:transaldolase n=1 Tax=unclassified Mesorhizobium TaxID=325217 RepID=UPI001127B139|nr:MULTISPECIES: transaldolase [unclassified Mesorhizobium]MBZ9894574.1 transaldolase [Mesorhizobium sp. BR1-1-6]TPM57498.1 transaldolase [Mesorhizobium sp. B2-2-4]TPM65699.1 transaldolase [Mesorhizobium sp. B2-2-1]TPN38391.1 transaldolase [Mesorhizobium sp. B1-1-6]TPN72024.1 transaldolase [Mesorhizobium sp. B1-1-3]
MASKLDQLRTMTTIVADSGDFAAVARLKPTDCTTNPTIVLKAIDTPEYGNVVDEALAWGRSQSGDGARLAAATADRLAVSIGVELLRLVPGYVSTEVDANLSFNIGASVARARQIIEAYKQRGIEPERVLIKLASTWEGIRAAQILQGEGVKCNMTLLLNRAQAIASAEAGAFLISPFVGRIYDWHKKSSGRDFTADEDPGVRSVRDIYGYYKSNGIETIVMGASFRNTGQIEALAGCDRLTIAPALMDALASEEGRIKRVLAPTAPEPRSLRTAEDEICHWFVSEDAVDLKHLAPEGPMDETTFRWIMNEDAMATEKLAEGIRVFANDLKVLRRRIAERLL